MGFHRETGTLASQGFLWLILLLILLEEVTEGLTIAFIFGLLLIRLP